MFAFLPQMAQFRAFRRDAFESQHSFFQQRWRDLFLAVFYPLRDFGRSRIVRSRLAQEAGDHFQRGQRFGGEWCFQFGLRAVDNVVERGFDQFQGFVFLQILRPIHGVVVAEGVGGPGSHAYSLYGSVMPSLARIPVSRLSISVASSSSIWS